MQTSLSDKIYQDLKWALIVGAYAPGDRISIRTQAEALGVSMMPVREALKRLASERVLQASAKRSFQVAALDPKRISNLLFVRSSLEGIATELATPKLTTSQLDRILELAALMDKDIDRQDIPGYLARNYSFHFSIYSAADNAELVSLIEGLWAQTGPFIAAGARASGMSGDWRETHRRIVDAIRVRDSDQARRLIEQDISWGITLYRRMVEQQQAAQ